ncbi:MAG: YdeI/OmpD-associated family protein [Christensenellales bacterium]
MSTDTQAMRFQTREDFRAWLEENAGTSEGVWLLFGKTKAVATLKAAEALEEALCFGWIDGVMKRVDDDTYIKYFAQRREKSVWSDKNKKLLEKLRAQGLLTERGERAVAIAKENGMWDAPKNAPITDEQIEEFAQKLVGISPACENFHAMPRSVRATYTGRCLSFKTEDGRARDFERIVDRLNKNLKPM